MTTLKNFLGIVLMSLFMLFSSCVKEKLYTGNENLDSDQNLNEIDTRSVVVPEIVARWQSGDADFECGQAGSSCDFSWKIDDSAPNGTYHTNSSNYGNTPTDFDVEIEITNSDGFTFDWSSDYKVCAVIVKGGPSAHVYRYPGGSCGDTGLTAPVNPKNSQNYQISHVSLCFDDTPCGSSDNDCYQEETAWSSGPRYKRRGNWATYTPYPGDGGEVDIYAGQNMLAGTVTFVDKNNGYVDLIIDLDNTFIFYYDIADQIADENIKVQDYSSAPSGNPAPGQFTYKKTADAGATSYTLTVPMNSYYGIHLDVGYEVSCD